MRLVAGLAVDPHELAAEAVVALRLVAPHLGAVAPSVRPADEALVDAGELQGLVAELLLVRGAGAEVERPSPQHRRAVVRTEALRSNMRS